MRDIASAAFIGGALLLAGCEHGSTTLEGAAPPETRNTIDVRAAVTISDDSAGGQSFRYQAPFFDEDGNFDFSKQGAVYNTVRLTFVIAPESVAGIRFKPDAADAMWIVEKKNVDKATGSPSGPYRGAQFFDFSVSEGGSALSVTDRNDDGVLYRYGLRFDLDGETVFDDPDGMNGGRR